MADTLWNMRGAVKNIKPNCPGETVDQLLNKHVQSVVKKRSWSDLLRLGVIVIPNAYSTGTVSPTAGSALLAGTGTAWPLNDALNTTLISAVVENPGMCDISPASMAGIMQGDFMVLDLGTGSQEVVVAAHVSVDHFSAYCRFSHGTGAPLQKSSLANLQVKLGNNQVTTVQAVLSATSIQMDRPFGGPAIPNSLYQIYMAYARISNTAYRLLDAGDTVQGARLGTDKTVDWLNIYDPQRTTSGDLQELVSTVPAAGGVMQWELWPGQLSAVVIQVMYVDGWPKLKSNGDMSPYFLNEEIFVALSTADALNTKFIPSASRATVDPYYDPMAAKRFEMQGREYLEDAIQQDQGRYMTMLTNYAQQLHGVGIGNVAYEAAHVPWPSDLD